MANVTKKTQQYLGDYTVSRASFANIDAVFAGFHSSEFKKRSARKRFQAVNQQLLDCILSAPEKAFLLPAVIEYIARVNKEQLLEEPLHINLFEFWLNQFSGISEQENYKVRGKITGKYILREDYQAIFPIGMGKTFQGSHFVAAHLSPDADTMIASFWGWADAFSARVGDALHIWSLPGGAPDTPATTACRELLGEAVFDVLANPSTSLRLAAIDLVSQKGFIKTKGDTQISSLTGDKAVVLVDDAGYYLGDWHQADYEPVRKVIIRFKSCLRWFENNLHVKLISLFAKKGLNIRDLGSFAKEVFDVPIKNCEPVLEFDQCEKKDLNDFFIKVLGLKKGLDGTFRELNAALAQLSVNELSDLQLQVEALSSSDLFDEKGQLKENRPEIFNTLEKLIYDLDRAIHRVRDYAERLDVALSIKRNVLGHLSQYVTMRSEVDDLRIMMKKLEYLTVVIPAEDGQLFPVGVVWANILNKSTLGTVTFRDFCNQEEVKMAPYLVPISVMDHHKTSLKTSSPPLAIISDAQSCNVLLAEQAFAVNDRYGHNELSKEQLESETKALQSLPSSLETLRLLQRLMQRRLAADTCGPYYIHADREWTEYVCILHAILDDTDLLTKVSKRDVECVAKLINRMKSLSIKKDVLVIDLDTMALHKDFAKAAAKQILHNPEMYSFYKKIYEAKEGEVEKNLTTNNEADYQALFVDTKEQNGCCRVGQSKLFSVNMPTYRKHAAQFRSYWAKNAQEVYEKDAAIDLHIHMISTIPSADEVYKDKVGHYSHQDELWFWVPSTPRAYDHLTSFLVAFQSATKFVPSTSNLEFLSETPEEMEQIFIRNLPGLSHKKLSGKPHLSMAVLYFPAGLLNSRKAMITPYLPRIMA